MLRNETNVKTMLMWGLVYIRRNKKGDGFHVIPRTLMNHSIYSEQRSEISLYIFKESLWLLSKGGTVKGEDQKSNDKMTSATHMRHLVA